MATLGDGIVNGLTMPEAVTQATDQFNGNFGMLMQLLEPW